MLRRFLATLCCAAIAVSASGQNNNGSLKNVPVPQANLGQYVRDQATLVVLGKALFWDMQVGSDARMGWASCHFHAGADHRSQNMVSNPGKSFTANYTLTTADFPFHQLSSVANNGSSVVRDTGQRAASSGTFRRDF